VLNQGDLVRKGDVVQTSGSSSVSITLADGSTFSLSPNARMVLNDFVYDANASNNSAVINLVQGTFGFVAGQVAKTGDMRVETPVATMGIRGTAVLVEISANDGRTKFSVMIEPDGTTGAFNLYNKTTGALLATVNNSNVGWVVNPVGPLQVVANEVQKTPGELQFELGVVQQLFNIINNYQLNPIPDSERRGDAPNPNPQTAGGTGSGDPTTGNIQKVTFSELITQFSQGGNGSQQPASFQTPTPNSDGLPQVVDFTVSQNKPPVANPDPSGSADGGDVIDNDSDPEGGNIVVQSVQHIDPVQGVPSGPVVHIPQGDLDGETIEGTYGTLTIHPDGTYTFVPHGGAFDALAEGDTETDQFQYTISDPFGATDTAILTINLTGVNDAPVLNSFNLTVAEGGTVVLSLADLNITDPDDSDFIISVQNVTGGEFQVWNGSAWVAAPTGGFTTLQIAAGEVQFVHDGGEAEPSFSIWVSDGTDISVPISPTVNFTPVNDDPVAVCDPFENIPLGWELGPDNHLYKYVSASHITWQSAAAAALAAGGYLATITSDAENNFVFSLVGNDVAWLGGSDAGQEGQWRWVTGEAFDYTHWDGGEPNNHGDGIYWLLGEGEDYLVTWGNHSWNDLDNSSSDRGYIDGYVIERNGIAGANYLQITEDDPNTILASWLLDNDTDIDGDLLTITAVTSGMYGATISINCDGDIVYDASSSAYFQALGAGQTATDTFSYTISDGHGGTSTATVTVTVNGLNDAPTDVDFVAGGNIASADGGLLGGLVPGLGSLKTIGTFHGIDPDQGASFTYSLGSGSSSGFILSSNGALTTGLLGVGSGNYSLNMIATDEHGASSAPIPFTIWVGSNNNNTQNMSGLSNDVIAFGLRGNDAITSGSGNDVLVGGGGNDTLIGGQGRDTLIGGAGHDTLTGGVDHDTFVFSTNEGHDTITDMHFGDPLTDPNADIIDLSAFGYTNVSQLTLDRTHTDLRINLGSGHWIDLSGIPHDAVLNNQNFHF
jgi:VCBS repeat-containing protein